MGLSGAADFCCVGLSVAFFVFSAAASGAFDSCSEGAGVLDDAGSGGGVASSVLSLLVVMKYVSVAMTTTAKLAAMSHDGSRTVESRYVMSARCPTCVPTGHAAGPDASGAAA